MVFLLLCMKIAGKRCNDLEVVAGEKDFTL